MLWRSVAAGALAAVVGWAWAAPAQAGDVFRLGLNGEAPAFDLKGDGGAPDLTTQWRAYRRGYYRGYYNGYYGGYGSYYPRYYGGYYGSYYPRYYGSYYYPGYYGYSYYPRYYGGYYGSYYPGYSYYYPGYYYGISYNSPIGCPAGDQDVPGVVLTPGGKGTAESYKQPTGPMKPVPQEGTYPYDGGPSDPVPMPKAEPAPAGSAPRTVPLEGRPVSLPPAAPKKKYDYLAYGEKPTTTAAPELPKRFFAQDRIVVLTADPAKKAPR
jgi:hypothetical protein